MRKTLQALRLDVLRVVEDPSTSGVNAGRLFDYLQDLQDTLTPAYGALSTSVGRTFNLTTSDQIITWVSEVIAQLPEFTTNPAAGSITRTDAVCSNRILVNMDVELATTREVEFTLYANNVATVWRTKASGSGSGRPAVCSFEALHYSTVPVTFTLKALVDTATPVTISNAIFLVSAVPVREV